MTASSHTWTETLGPYLARSNEDEATLRFVLAHVLPRLLGARHIRWLDVGSGPATKTALLRNALSSEGVSVEVLCVEPAFKSWRNRPNAYADANVYAGDLGDYIATTARLDFDLITCFHVLYDRESIDQFARLLLRLRTASKATTIAVSVESESSDFHLMRAKLRGVSPTLPLPAVRTVREMFRRLELMPVDVDISPQHCILGSVHEVRAWLLPFLLGTSLAEPVAPAARDIIDNFVLERGLRLTVPDTGFILSIPL